MATSSWCIIAHICPKLESKIQMRKNFIIRMNTPCNYSLAKFDLDSFVSGMNNYSQNTENLPLYTSFSGGEIALYNEKQSLMVAMATELP